MGKKISELTNRLLLSGNEDLPFLEGQDNGSITIHSLNEYISNSNVNQAINQIKQAEQQAISNFSSQKVSPEMLSESTKQLINASGGGTITNLADDEDIESVGLDLKVLKFADRAYNPGTHVGMGYKILRRNIIDGKNILTQDMVNQPHTIYMIQYDFDLDGATIKIPEGCILDFQGGSIVNGKVFSDNKTTRIVNPPKITESNDKIFFGVFFDSNNGELTYRFEKINRPFEIIGQVATTRASKEYWNARRIGINKYNIFLPHVFSNGEWSFGDSNIDEAIELLWLLKSDDKFIGSTSERPSSPPLGFSFYDTSLGKPIWWNGSSWTDASGATV